MNDDTISRQAAIDGLRVGEELLSRVLEDTEVVGNVRDKYEWGLGLLKSCISDIEDLPPAQPEPCEKDIIGMIKKYTNCPVGECRKAFDIAIDYLRSKSMVKG